MDYISKSACIMILVIGDYFETLYSEKIVLPDMINVYISDIVPYAAKPFTQWNMKSFNIPLLYWYDIWKIICVKKCISWSKSYTIFKNHGVYVTGNFIPMFWIIHWSDM